MKRAFITGIAGQDGSYLAEFLLSKGYTVHGLIRRHSNEEDALRNIEHIRHQITLHHGDMTDANSLFKALVKADPREIYNLAAQSHVRVSFDNPEYTLDATATGPVRLLEAVRTLVQSSQLSSHVRIYQASSSEMFGGTQTCAQSENTAFAPQSPYGCAKLAAHWAVRNYREGYAMHASSGILFNHESPRRGTQFVTRKITRAVANIVAGRQKELWLGNLSAFRDWGFAGDYVEAMWTMLQQPLPGDYVIATGMTHRVEEFLVEAFRLVDLDWRKYVRHDPNMRRPNEVSFLLGDALRAERVLGWKPRTSFKQLVKMMVAHDLAAVGHELEK